MRNVLTIVFILSSFIFVNAQATDEISLTTGFDYYPDYKVNMGFGLGMDYGGIGLRVNGLVSKTTMLFGGLGYNFNGAGFNAGTWFRLAPLKKVCPTLGVMYGYNAVIVVKGASEYNKTYYGPSIGAGMEIRSRHSNNFVNLELLIPFRSQEYSRDIDMIRSNPYVDLNEPLPFTISIGFHTVL